MTTIIIVLSLAAVFWWYISARNESAKRIELRKRADAETAKWQRAEDDKKARLVKERPTRTSVNQWAEEFEMLEATCFFNPRRGQRIKKLQLDRHNYSAQMEQFFSETGQYLRKLVVADSNGRLLKINTRTENCEHGGCRDCVITDNLGRIIGGWQLAHEAIPFEFAAACVNQGIVYSSAYELPTTGPKGYRPDSPAFGWAIVMNYSVNIDGREKDYSEGWLEAHFEEFLQTVNPNSTVTFKKCVHRIHYSMNTAEPRLNTDAVHVQETTGKQEKRNAHGEPHSAFVRAQSMGGGKQEKRTAHAEPSVPPVPSPKQDNKCTDSSIPINVETLSEMILRKQNLTIALAEGRRLSSDDQRELAMLGFLLDPTDETPIVKLAQFDIDDVAHLTAFDRFTFGDVKRILTALGLSKDDVLSFLRDVSTGAMPLVQAIEFMTDCEAWSEIKESTELTRAEFFAQRLASRRNQQGQNPSRN